MRNLFLLDPEVIFLNHGSFGACPKPVFEVYQAFQRELERRPVEFLALERRFPELLDEARGRLAAYVGTHPENLVFVPNASTAINTAAGSLELAEGDEILLGDAEYGGMQTMWEHLAATSGAHLVRRPFGELQPGPRTRAIFCSHVEWSTGRVNDVTSLCDRAREAGVVTIVDGAHAPGQIDLDLESIGADVYAGNCHKWLCAPKGSAFLYVAPCLQSRVEPAVVSWDRQDGAPFHLRHRWQGTRDPSAYLSVPAAIDFQAAHDWDDVRARCHDLLAAADLGLDPVAGGFAQMRAYRLDHPDPPALQKRLYERHRIEVPVIQTIGGWVLRVSMQGYNEPSDLEALAAALREEDAVPGVPRRHA